MKITVKYIGKFKNGIEFDNGEITFETEKNQVVPGFEENIKEMAEGEKKTFTLEPKDAYGEVNEKMVQEVPNEAIEKIRHEGLEITPGKTLALKTPDGHAFPVLVRGVTETGVVLDMNHPLAGKTLIFEVEVVKIE